VWWFARGVSLVAAVLLYAGGLPLFYSQPSSKFPLAYYARYTHPLDQEADEGSLVVPQQEASEDAD
jgi:hypothetical protein